MGAALLHLQHILLYMELDEHGINQLLQQQPASAVLLASRLPHTGNRAAQYGLLRHEMHVQ